MPEPDRPLFVLGMPHGHTSLVSGALHHLGVGFGDWRPRKPYPTFEDIRLRPMVFQPHDENFGKSKAQLKALVNFWESYVETRIEEAGPRRWGVKAHLHRFLLCSPQHIGAFQVVRVTRDLSEAVEADLRAARASSPRADRSGVLAAWSELAERVWKEAKGGVTVRGQDLLDDPTSALLQLAEDTHLDPSREQYEAAERFLRPEEPTVQDALDQIEGEIEEVSFEDSEE